MSKIDLGATRLAPLSASPEEILALVEIAEAAAALHDGQQRDSDDPELERRADRLDRALSAVRSAGAR